MERKYIVTKRKNGSTRIQVDTSDWKSKTDQSFKNDCDAKTIMDRFMKTGQITHLNKNQGRYADVSEIPDLSDALNTVTKAQEAFDSLPAQIRKRFGNSPVQMVEFLSDPKNYPEAEKLGLLTLKSSSSSLSDVPSTPKPPVGNPKPPKKQKNSQSPPNDDDSNDDD